MKVEFNELMIGILTAKINASICHCTFCCSHHKGELTADEISFIRTVADNIYTFAVADGMNRAFEAMRRDVMPEDKP